MAGSGDATCDIGAHMSPLACIHVVVRITYNADWQSYATVCEVHYVIMQHVGGVIMFTRIEGSMPTNEFMKSQYHEITCIPRSAYHNLHEMHEIIQETFHEMQ